MASEANGGVVANEKGAETVGVGRYVEMEQDQDSNTVKSRLSGLLWHGGSAYDAWFSCASNQVNELCRRRFLPSSRDELGAVVRAEARLGL
jgi:auxin influx carrier (AUX1 LAX family)